MKSGIGSDDVGGNNASVEPRPSASFGPDEVEDCEQRDETDFFSAAASFDDKEGDLLFLPSDSSSSSSSSSSANLLLPTDGDHNNKGTRRRTRTHRRRRLAFEEGIRDRKQSRSGPVEGWNKWGRVSLHSLHQPIDLARSETTSLGCREDGDALDENLLEVPAQSSVRSFHTCPTTTREEDELSMRGGLHRNTSYQWELNSDTTVEGSKSDSALAKSDAKVVSPFRQEVGGNLKLSRKRLKRHLKRVLGYPSSVEDHQGSRGKQVSPCGTAPSHEEHSTSSNDASDFQERPSSSQSTYADKVQLLSHRRGREKSTKWLHPSTVGGIGTLHDQVQDIKSQAQERLWRYRYRKPSGSDGKGGVDGVKQLSCLWGKSPAPGPPVKEYRVQPAYAYPTGGKQSSWMTASELEREMLKPSAAIQAPYGGTSLRGKPIGYTIVELLSCSGLPKIDRFALPDVVAYACCGPYAFASDVICGTNKPRWPCQSKRAVRFPLHHAYAQTKIGIFDDSEYYFGRVVIDISRLRPRTTYDVSIPLRDRAHVYTRRPRGVVRVRIRLEWHEERAAVLSYLPAAPFRKERGEEPVTIKCGDALAARNLAFTLNGSDMPGTVSKSIMTATARELSLYNHQFRAVVKECAREISDWDNPVLSTFVFVGWMHGVYRNSVSLTYPYVLGLAMLYLYRNYLRYCADSARHEGFTPLTLTELASSLLRINSCERHSMRGLNVQPTLPEQVMPPADQSESTLSTVSTSKSRRSFSHLDGGPRVYRDHMEFPFSVASRCGKLSVAESKVAKYPKRSHTHGKSGDGNNSTSGYYSDAAVLGTDKEQSIRSDGTSVAANSTRALPEQNIDAPVEKKKFRDDIAEMLQVANSCTLGLFEDTGKLFVKQKRPSNHHARRGGGDWDAFERSHVGGDDTLEWHFGTIARQNPVLAVSERYIGPMVQIFRVPLFACRALFNLFMWTDPYLSFWFLLALAGMTLVLLIFPWRLFMLALGVAIVGPQNYFLRREEETKPSGHSRSTRTKRVNHISPPPKSGPCCSRSNGAFYSHRRNAPSLSTPAFAMKSERELFEQHVHVNYSMMRTDRFYDWPPASTLSTATAAEQDGSYVREEPRSETTFPKQQVHAGPPVERVLTKLRQRKISSLGSSMSGA